MTEDKNENNLRVDLSNPSILHELSQLATEKDFEEALHSVASANNMDAGVLRKLWSDHVRISAGVKTRISNHVGSWMKLVMDCLDSDESMKIGEACKIVFEQHEEICVKAGVKSPRGMMRMFGMYVQMGYIKYNLNGRVSNKIGDKKPPDRVLYKDKSKMKQEFKYLVNTGVRDKSLVLSRVSRAFHHKYSTAILEEYLSDLPGWEKVK